MSVFKQMIGLRDQVQSIYVENESALKWLINGAYPGKEFIPVPINNHNYLIQFLNDTGNWKARIRMDTVLLTDPFAYNEIEDVWDETLLYDPEYTIRDLFTMAGLSTSAYEVLSQLATKFSYVNRIQLNDVNQFISRCGSVDLSDLQDDFFEVSNDEGFLTLPAFVSVLNSYMNTSKDTVDDESLAVDTSNPFTIQYLLNIAIAATSAVLSAICTALSSVFGGVCVLLGLVIQAISSIFNSINELGDYEIDASASSDFVAGPLTAIERYGSFLTSKPTLSTLKDRRIRYIENNGVGAFNWWNDDYTDLKNNEYFYPCFKPYETFEYLVSNNYVQLTQYGSSDVWTLTVSSVFNFDNAIYHCVTKYADASQRPTDACEYISSLAIGLLINQILGWNKCFLGDSSDDRSFSIQDDWFNSVDLTKAADERATREAFRLLIMGYTHASSHDTFNAYVRDHKLDRAFANELTSHFAENIIPNNSHPLGRASNNQGLVVVGTNISNGVYPNQWPLLYSYSFINPVIKSNKTNQTFWIDNSDYGSMDIADCLPTSFGIKLPVMNAEQLYKTLGLIASVTIATAMISTPLRLAMKDRKVAKNALRADDVNKKREAYLADPTNATKRDDFAKTARKYDTFGKIFGWGSYDAANGWVNSPQSSGSSFISNFADSIYSSYISSDSLETLILQIKNLITSN